MHIIEPLFEKSENYVKTSLELYKLNTISKAANVISTVASRGILFLIFSIVFVSANIGAALWIGDLLGKAYYGFFCVAGFYFFIGAIVFLFMRKHIKKCVSNSIISHLLN